MTIFLFPLGQPWWVKAQPQNYQFYKPSSNIKSYANVPKTYLVLSK